MSEIKETIDAVSKLTENIPIYEDLVQPTAQELGRNLHTVSKVVTVALSPVKGLVWGFERIEAYLSDSLSQKLENTAEKNIQAPPVKIAGPVFEALRFCSEEIELKEMFANLLANSMDKKTKHEAHPAFVEVLKNINGEEAKILLYIAAQNNSNYVFPVIDQSIFFKSSSSSTIINPLTSMIASDAGCQFLEMAVTYINNLTRLGILVISDHALVKAGMYDEIEKSKLFIKNKKNIESMQQHSKDTIKHKSTKKNISLTNFGIDFINIAVRDKNIKI